jgi:hypothetical protein
MPSTVHSGVSAASLEQIDSSAFTTCASNCVPL